MTDLVFDVTYTSYGMTMTARGCSSDRVCQLTKLHTVTNIHVRKLLPCAQRPAAARIATPSPAGPSPATGRGGDL